MLPFTTFLNCKTGCADWLCADACVPAAGGNALPGQASGFRTDNQIESAIINSILTWKRNDDAKANRVNPRVRNGWWADTDSSFGNVGSLLWKLPYMPRTTQTLAFAKTETEAALQWMIDKGYASTISATASFLASERIIEITVSIDKETFMLALATQDCLGLRSFSCTTKCR